MIKQAEGRYMITLRSDYLDALDRLIAGMPETDRDICIQNAIIEYSGLPENEREVETNRQELRPVRWAGSPPSGHEPAAITISCPDELFEGLQTFDFYNDLDINLNAAIRIWLQNRDVEGLEP